MHCCVACPSPQLHLSSSPWPCEGLRFRVKTSGGSRNGCWASSLSGRKGRKYEENGSSVSTSRSRSRSGSRRSQSSLSSRLGFVENGVVGSNELRSSLRGDCFLPSVPYQGKEGGAQINATLMLDPAVWVIRTAAFYFLLESGIAGPRRAQYSGGEQSADNGPLAWLGKLIGGDPEEKRNKELARTRSKWHASTKGTLVRRYRVPSKKGGRKLLQAISSLLADDDTFRDVATHKGCQIRRENAHAESVCCHNVRALFDELPTPHLVVDITVFPPGPITTAHYEKADKIEKVLRTGASI